MTNNPVLVEPTEYFRRVFKRLRKKLRHLEDDLKSLIELLQQGETPGDQVPGVGYTVFKVRLASQDLQRGKSGGLRVLYYLRRQDHILLLEIYFKSERTDIPPEVLRRLIEDVEKEFPTDNTE